MKLLSFVVGIICVSIALWSCKKANSTLTPHHASHPVEATVPDSVESIEALYYNCITLSKAMYGWDDLKKDIPAFDRGICVGVLDGSIENPKVKTEIQQLIDGLQPDVNNRNFMPDYRIVATVKYKSGKTERLGISGSLMNTIYLNDTLQLKNNRLIYLIKNYLGIYPWLIGDRLNDQEELFDNSYSKDPFVESKYYKMYQQYQ